MQRLQCLLTSWKGFARPLFGGDGFDDELPAILRIKRDMCVLLGDFLRTTLRVGEHPLIPFSEELGLLERFLSIEKVRFGARLRTTQQAANSTSGYNGTFTFTSLDAFAKGQPSQFSITSGQPLAQFDPYPSRECRNRRVVLAQEGVELPFWIRGEFGLCEHR